MLYKPSMSKLIIHTTINVNEHTTSRPRRVPHGGGLDISLDNAAAGEHARISPHGVTLEKLMAGVRREVQWKNGPGRLEVASARLVLSFVMKRARRADR